MLLLSAWLPAPATAALSALVALLGVLFWRRHSRNRFLELAAKIPGPPTTLLLGNALDFMCEPEDLMPLFRSYINQYGDVVRFWLGPDLNVIVSDPDDLKTLLSSPKLSVKGPSYKYMAEYIGGGILSGSGPLWRRHRKIANFNYGERAIEVHGQVFNQELDLLLKKLHEKPEETEFDIFKDIVKTTSNSVCQTLMGLSKEETTNLPRMKDLIDHTDRFYSNLFKRMTNWWLQVEFVFWFTEAHKFLKIFHEMSSPFCSKIIETRTQALEKREHENLCFLGSEEDTTKNTELCVIDRFILSKELNSQELIDETFTFFTASQEASAKICSYMLLMMAYHPEYQERLYAEIVSVLGDKSDRPITGEDLKRMTYLDMVFKECIRLFPIAAITQRTVTEEFKISAYTLPAGCSLVVPIYQMQRDPRYWEHPDDFYPDHFTRESIKKRPANCYLPFSIGPMDCIGRYYGAKLVKTLCAGVVREFQLTSNQTYKDLRTKVAVAVYNEDGYRDKVYQEILEVVGPDDRPVSEEDLKRLYMLDCVYKEALRYLPIAACIQRTATEEIPLERAPVTIPVGTSVIIPIHALHRDPKYWYKPNKVRPERFLPEESKTRDPNAFIPFSLGAMDCLGRVYATAVIKTLVVRVIRHYQLVAEGKIEDLDLDIAFSVKFKDGFNLQVLKRAQPI